MGDARKDGSNAKAAPSKVKHSTTVKTGGKPAKK